MPGPSKSPWSDPNADVLLHELLVVQSLSAAEVAAAMQQNGYAVSRCAVIGRAHRKKLGFSRKPCRRLPPEQRKPKRRPRAPQASPSSLPPPVPVVDSPPLINVPPATLLELSGCRWPLHRNAAGVRLFCNARCLSGTPYCRTHARISVKTVPIKEIA